jgi:O-acetyl-ADP-ribose deacetylase (regulator of RNase III)
MIKYITGNLITLAENEEIDVLVHGCNTNKIMGAGIAKQIKTKWPKAHLMDLNSKLSVEEKLNGQFTYVVIDAKLIIVNAYIQERTALRYNEVVVNYDAMHKALSNVRREFSGLRFGFPQIGCGLAGGDWDGTVKPMIEKIFNNEDVTVVEFYRR